MFREKFNYTYIIVDKNDFITRITLPPNFWYINMSIKSFEKYSSADKPNSMGNQNENNIFEIKVDHQKKDDELPYFMRPRKDWHISQGDYIVEETKEIKRKFLTKQDWKNLKSGLWYILISSLIIYITLHSIAKLG